MQNLHCCRKYCVKNWKYCGIIAKPCEAMCRNIFHPPVSVSPAVGEGPPCLRSNKTCTNSQQMRSEKIIKHISRIKYNWCICGNSSQEADIQWAVDHMWYSQQFLPTIHTACTGLGSSVHDRLQRGGKNSSTPPPAATLSPPANYLQCHPWPSQLQIWAEARLLGKF